VSFLDHGKAGASVNDTTVKTAETPDAKRLPQSIAAKRSRQTPATAVNTTASPLAIAKKLLRLSGEITRATASPDTPSNVSEATAEPHRPPSAKIRRQRSSTSIKLDQLLLLKGKIITLNRWKRSHLALIDQFLSHTAWLKQSLWEMQCPIRLRFVMLPSQHETA